MVDTERATASARTDLTSPCRAGRPPSGSERRNRNLPGFLTGYGACFCHLHPVSSSGSLFMPSGACAWRLTTE